MVLVAASILDTEFETYPWLITVLAAIAHALAVLSTALLRRHNGAQAPSG